MKASTRGRGVTLIELSTTLAAVAIALSLGIPAFRGLQADIQSNRVCSALTASFGLARSEAARRGAAVRLCPSVDGSTCTGEPVPDWSVGWIVTTAGRDVAEVLDSTHFDGRPNFALTADAALARGVTFTGADLPSATGAFTYRDGTSRSVLRLLPIGRLEAAP